MKAGFFGIVCLGVLGCENSPAQSGRSDGGEYYVVGQVARWTMEETPGYSFKILDPLTSGYFVGEEVQLVGPDARFHITGKEFGPLKSNEWSHSFLLRLSKVGSVTNVENLGLATDHFDTIRALRNR